MSQAPLVTVVILHWHNITLTRSCLSNLKHQSWERTEVVVVDNGSDDGAVAKLQREYPDVTFVQLDHNRGFAGGVNPGIDHALVHGADYVLLLNNDANVAPDFLAQMVACAEASPNVGILSPLVVRDDDAGRLAGLGCRLKHYSLELVGWNTPTPTTQNSTLIALDAVFGCAMLIRRSVFAYIGSFDERFFFYYEDVDFCLRAREAGFEVAYVPNIRVSHAVSSSTRSVPGLRDFYLSRSRQLFFRKHMHGFHRLVWAMSECISVLRVIRAKIKEGNLAHALGYFQGTIAGAAQRTS